MSTSVTQRGLVSGGGNWSYGGYFDYILDLDNPSAYLPAWKDAREHIDGVFARIQRDLIPEITKYISIPTPGALILPGPSYGESFYDYEKRKQRFAVDFYEQMCTTIEWDPMNTVYQEDYHVLNREIPRFRALLNAIHSILKPTHKVEPTHSNAISNHLETGKELLQLRPKLAARLEANKNKTFADWLGRPAAANPMKETAANVSIASNSNSSSGNSSGEQLSRSDGSDVSLDARSTPTDEQVVWENDDCDTAYSISSPSSPRSLDSFDPSPISSSARSRLYSSSSASSYVSCLSADAPSAWALDVEWRPFGVGPAPERRKQMRRRGGYRAKMAKNILFEKVAAGSNRIPHGFSKNSTIIDPAALFGFMKKEKMVVIDEEKEKEQQAADLMESIINGMQYDIEAEITGYFEQIARNGGRVDAAC